MVRSGNSPMLARRTYQLPSKRGNGSPAKLRLSVLASGLVVFIVTIMMLRLHSVHHLMKEIPVTDALPVTVPTSPSKKQISVHPTQPDSKALRASSSTKKASSSKLLAAVPDHAKNTYYIPKGDIRPFAAARNAHDQKLHFLKDTMEEAHIIWTKREDPSIFTKLKPWQRYNHLPKTDLWDDKAKHVEGMREYAQKTGHQHEFEPKTFVLYREADRVAFLDYLKNGNGKDQPWVLKVSHMNQGKGVTVIAPNSPELDDIEAALLRGDAKYTDPEEKEVIIIQQYLCNGLLYHGRKFDLRAYWMVASLDPLVILFRNVGIMRVAGNQYDESDFRDTASHITNVSRGEGAGPVGYDEFVKMIRAHYEANKDQLPHVKGDPVLHVHNQMKAAVAEMVKAYRDKSFVLNELTSQNGFADLGADFYFDKDLHVYLVEPQSNPDHRPEDAERRAVHPAMLSSMIDIVIEVQDKQSRGEALLPLDNMGDWELINTDDFQFTYEYQRPPPKGCFEQKGYKEAVF